VIGDCKRIKGFDNITMGSINNMLSHQNEIQTNRLLDSFENKIASDVNDI
jgi:hypothetical protein